jgi:hypothetical protein
MNYRFGFFPLLRWQTVAEISASCYFLSTSRVSLGEDLVFVNNACSVKLLRFLRIGHLLAALSTARSLGWTRRLCSALRLRCL